MSNLFTALKEHHQINSVSETVNSIDLITKVYTELIQAIYDNKPDIKQGEVFIETLSFKIIITTRSILEHRLGSCPHEPFASVKLHNFIIIKRLVRGDTSQGGGHPQHGVLLCNNHIPPLKIIGKIIIPNKQNVPQNYIQEGDAQSKNLLFSHNCTRFLQKILDINRERNDIRDCI